MENTSISVINSRILIKFCTWVVHDKSIAHTEQNSEISTYVIDNDIIMLKFECFRRKHSILKNCISVLLWMKLGKNWQGHQWILAYSISDVRIEIFLRNVIFDISI